MPLELGKKTSDTNLAFEVDQVEPKALYRDLDALTVDEVLVGKAL